MLERTLSSDKLEPQFFTADSVPPVTSKPELGSGAERPSLKSHVRPAGKISGLGFQESQWLLDNGGTFVQVSELLYRIAEHADGEHTLEQIADKLTDSTEWSLDGADVDWLIQSKLAPLGLIETGEAAEHLQPASPLGVNLKFRALSPRFIESVTAILHLLCHRVIVPLVLGAGAIGRWWLYRHHGLASGIQDAIYVPGGLLLALAMVLLAAVFHEFGHASALRHHGGKVGNMGAGFYIIYPVLYTDISDNYRLSRWARISTDLGGVYFHIIFSLVLFAAYFVSHRELLFFAVFLIDLEILEQFLPFVRLDGYWLLCDITGIPDFFSQMMPFLRTLLPLKLMRVLDAISGEAAGRRERLPEVKAWVKLAFATYILATIPFLIYVLAKMIASLPDLVGEMWTGLQVQTQLLGEIGIWKDPLTTLLVLLQIVLLILPVPATIYFLWITLKAPLSRFVDWASSRPRQAFAAAAATLMCGGIVAAFVIAPSLRPFHHYHRSRVQQLLQETQEATAKLSNLTAELEGAIGEDYYTGKIILRRPNFARVEINGTKGLGKILLIADGSTATTYFSESNEFVQVPAGEHGQFIQSTVLSEVEQFFNPDSLGRNRRLEYIGHQLFDGTETDVVQSSESSVPEGQVNYFIARSDKLVHRVEEKSKSPGQAATWVLLKNMKTNTDVDGSAFAWSLPRTAKPLQLPAGIKLPVQ